MRNGGGRPMRLMRLAGPGLALAAFVVLLGAVAPQAPGAESVRSFIEGGGPGGNEGGSLLGPLLLVGLAIAIAVAVGAAVILFRTRGGASTVVSEGWWTCPSCGAGNIDGAARCHACATWRTTAPRPTPSASP